MFTGVNYCVHNGSNILELSEAGVHVLIVMFR